MSKIIAIANQKGGVAKTTTAINLAASLAVAEKEVLLIDLDPQGNATSGVGVNYDTLGGSVYDLLIGRKTFPDLKIKTKVPHLDLLPSNIDLVGAEVELTRMEDPETLLKKVLDGFLSPYDYVIIDCPPSLGFLTLNSLTIANSLLIPLQCEYYALEGLKLLLRTMELVQKSLNPELVIEGILLTMFDNRNNLNNQVSDEVHTHFADQVFKSIIPRNITLAEAPSHGQPVLFYSAVSRGAQAYLALAKEIIQKK